MGRLKINCLLFCEYLNSHAGGMAVVRPYGFVIDSEKNSIFESAAWFFVITLEFILTLIFEIKIDLKIPWHQSNFIFEARFL